MSLSICWYLEEDKQKNDIKDRGRFCGGVIDFLEIKDCWCSDPGEERMVPDADRPHPGATKHSLEGVIEVRPWMRTQRGEGGLLN